MAATQTHPADSTADLGTAPIGRLLMHYSLPAIVASLATSLYNIIDSIFIGRGVGALAITGLAITFPLMNLVVAFCVLVAVGGSTISSIFLGQKDYSRAGRMGQQIIIQNYFQSIGKPGLSIFLSLTRQLIFLLPLLWLLSAQWGVEGAWAAMCGSDFLAFVLAITTAVVMNRRLARRMARTHPYQQ